MKKWTLSAATLLLAAGLATSASAVPVEVTSLTVTKMEFARDIGTATNGGTNENFANQYNMNIAMGSFTGAATFIPTNVWDPNANNGNGGYVTMQIASMSSGVVGAQYGTFGPFGAYTSPDDLNYSFPPVYDKYIAPSATVDAATGVLSLQMASWTAFWNGGTWNQGTGSNTTFKTGTYNGTTGAYSISWSKGIAGGPFNGCIGFWTLAGVANTVPEPASMLLIGSGLAGLFTLARRRK